MSAGPTWLPTGFKPLQNQVAGHTFLQNTDAIGLLLAGDTAYVLKPKGKPDCGERELKFYETLKHTKNPTLQQLRSLVPRFYKEVKLKIQQRELTFLQLENLTDGMVKPCIMDIKVGKRTWDLEASPKKRAVEEEKYAECKSALGLCIPGFQYYDYESGNLQRHGKEYGKQLNANGFKDTLKMFLNVKTAKHAYLLITEILQQLYAINNWFKTQTLLHFYASSILIVYDLAALQHLQASTITNGNNAQTKQEETNGITLRQCVKVRMIDFAHVFPAENNALDANYIFGVQKLVNLFEQLLVE